MYEWYNNIYYSLIGYLVVIILTMVILISIYGLYSIFNKLKNQEKILIKLLGITKKEYKKFNIKKELINKNV